MKKKIYTTLAIAAVVTAVLAPSAKAVVYDLDRITANSSVDIADQLYLDVLDLGAAVLFQVANLGPIASTIADVYWDDSVNAVLNDLLFIDNTVAGVSFSQYAAPGDLPGGSSMSVPFVTTVGLSADADSPVGGPNGNAVNVGESVGFIFDYAGSATFADVLAELDSGELRVGMHVQSIGLTGDSDSFVTHGDSQSVPDNGPTALLLGLALLGIEGLRRRSRVRVKV